MVLDAWQTSSPGPFLTITPGGPFEAVVTVAVAPAIPGRLVVDASWRRDGERRNASLIIDGYTSASRLAHGWANLLAAGIDPAVRGA
jgi:hypothetical protein